MEVLLKLSGICGTKTTNQCGYYHSVLDKNVLLSYNNKAVPYLGIRMNNGKFKGIYNVEIVPYDSSVNAKNKGCELIIRAGETYRVEVSYDVR